MHVSNGAHGRFTQSNSRVKYQVTLGHFMITVWQIHLININSYTPSGDQPMGEQEKYRWQLVSQNKTKMGEQEMKICGVHCIECLMALRVYGMFHDLRVVF